MDVVCGGPKVYLCGGISHMTYEQANEWRLRVMNADALDGRNYEFLNPLRGHESLAGCGILGPLCATHKAKYCEPKTIFARDKFDVDRCDILFANFLGAEKVSIFSVMELGWAFHANKFVLVVMEPGNVHDHICIRECASIIVPTLDEGIDYLANVL